MTTTVIDSDSVAGRNTTSSGRGPGHCQLVHRCTGYCHAPNRTKGGWGGGKGRDGRGGLVGGINHTLMYNSLIIFTVSFPTTAPVNPSAHTTVAPFRA